jgi:hypothetical protein
MFLILESIEYAVYRVYAVIYCNINMMFLLKKWCPAKKEQAHNTTSCLLIQNQQLLILADMQLKCSALSNTWKKGKTI